jgi:tetrahydromethanopterin S-methyltransferase subunit A
MLKIEPHPDYPAEKGRFVRGNDYSPVAVAVILNREEDKIPPEIEELVRVGYESGAALSGTVQTPNIGFEKIICNIVANPNIRYLILTGPESDGHLTGEALKALFTNGVDEKKNIIGTAARHAVLFNLPQEFITRFLEQLTLIDLQFRGTPELIRQVVCACFQEKPVNFENHELFDKGAWPDEPLSGKITSRIMEPWKVPDNEKEREAIKKMQALVEKLKNRKRES